MPSSRGTRTAPRCSPWSDPAPHVTEHLTVTGIGFGAAAGVAIALIPAGPIAGLDGRGAARRSARAVPTWTARWPGSLAPSSRFGFVTNELGDRLAEFAALAGVLALAAPGWVVAGGACRHAAELGRARRCGRGAPRVQGGPVGKTERAAAARRPRRHRLDCCRSSPLYGVGSLVTAVLRGRSA